jgi:hypothetical protein
MSPPPTVARMAVGMEKKAIASPSSAGVAEKSAHRAEMKGAMIPGVIIESTPGR